MKYVVLIFILTLDVLACASLLGLYFVKTRCGFACGKPEGGCWSRLGHKPIIHSPYGDS